MPHGGLTEARTYDGGAVGPQETSTSERPGPDGRIEMRPYDGGAAAETPNALGQ